MGPTLAVAELRFRECVSAHLAWLVPIALACGIGAALWADGPDPVDRARMADRVVFGLVGGLAILGAAVPAALGFPVDVQSGAVQTILASPVTRLRVILGGTLGYGVFASLLCAAMAAAGLVGLEIGGLGSGVREGVRGFEPAGPVEPAGAVTPEDGDGFVRLRPGANHGVFRFTVPAGLDPGGDVRVRLRPRPVWIRKGGGTLRIAEGQGGGVDVTFEPWPERESGRGEAMTFTTHCFLAVHPPGAPATSVLRTDFPLGAGHGVSVPLSGVAPGDEAELSIWGGEAIWRLNFPPGSVEVAGPRESFVRSAILVFLCAVPLLLLTVAAAGCGAVRFGTPTAIGIALFCVLLFAGQDLLRDAADYVIEVAADRAADPHAGHDHGDDRDHGPSGISTIQLAVARGTRAVVRLVPAIESFDRTGALVAGRTVRVADVGRAWASAMPGLILLTGLGWLLLRRREVTPG